MVQVRQNKSEEHVGEHILDNPPAFCKMLLPYGERPYWSADGKRIAFIEKNYGDAAEIDLETMQVRKLTHGLGEHHSFLRVLILANGDYLLIGPKEFRDRDISRHVESELWVLPKDLSAPPKPLGRRLFEGCGVSAIANRITYSMNGNHDPAIGSPKDFQVHVSEIVYGPNGAEIGGDKVIYRVSGVSPEPQDFRYNDSEVLMAEYCGSPFDGLDEWRCTVKGVNIETGEVRMYMSEKNVHNECEGIFPCHEHMTLECSGDMVNSFPPIDLWKMKLDGSMRRVRITRFIDHPPWRVSNSNISPDGKWMAFMVNKYDSEAGFGMGLGLFDIEAWEKTPEAHQWVTPWDYGK